jgi:hypothetical protein
MESCETQPIMRLLIYGKENQDQKREKLIAMKVG